MSIDRSISDSAPESSHRASSSYFPVRSSPHPCQTKVEDVNCSTSVDKTTNCKVGLKNQIQTIECRILNESSREKNKYKNKNNELFSKSDFEETKTKNYANHYFKLFFSSNEVDSYNLQLGKFKLRDIYNLEASYG